MKRRSKRKRRRRRTERKEVRCPLHASPSSERGSVTGSWRDGSTVLPNLSFFQSLSLFQNKYWGCHQTGKLREQKERSILLTLKKWLDHVIFTKFHHHVTVIKPSQKTYFQQKVQVQVESTSKKLFVSAFVCYTFCVQILLDANLENGDSPLMLDFWKFYSCDIYFMFAFLKFQIICNVNVAETS